MTDDDIVKEVFEANFRAWFGDFEGSWLDYNPKPTDDRTLWRSHAAKLNMYQTWHQPWREHLDNALEVVKNWRAE